MSKEGVDNSKRRFLSIAVNSVVGAVGVGFAAVIGDSQSNGT